MAHDNISQGFLIISLRASLKYPYWQQLHVFILTLPSIGLGCIVQEVFNDFSALDFVPSVQHKLLRVYSMDVFTVYRNYCLTWSGFGFDAGIISSVLSMLIPSIVFAWVILEIAVFQYQDYKCSRDPTEFYKCIFLFLQYTFQYLVAILLLLQIACIFDLTQYLYELNNLLYCALHLLKLSPFMQVKIYCAPIRQILSASTVLQVSNEFGCARAVHHYTMMVLVFFDLLKEALVLVPMCTRLLTYVCDEYAMSVEVISSEQMVRGKVYYVIIVFKAMDAKEGHSMWVHQHVSFSLEFQSISGPREHYNIISTMLVLVSIALGNPLPFPCGFTYPASDHGILSSSGFCSSGTSVFIILRACYFPIGEFAITIPVTLKTAMLLQYSEIQVCFIFVLYQHNPLYSTLYLWHIACIANFAMTRPNHGSTVAVHNAYLYCRNFWSAQVCLLQRDLSHSKGILHKFWKCVTVEEVLVARNAWGAKLLGIMPCYTSTHVRYFRCGGLVESFCALMLLCSRNQKATVRYIGCFDPGIFSIILWVNKSKQCRLLTKFSCSLICLTEVVLLHRCNFSGGLSLDRLQLMLRATNHMDVNCMQHCKHLHLTFSTSLLQQISVPPCYGISWVASLLTVSTSSATGDHMHFDFVSYHSTMQVPYNVRSHRTVCTFITWLASTLPRLHYYAALFFVHSMVSVFAMYFCPVCPFSFVLEDKNHSKGKGMSCHAMISYCNTLEIQG